MNENSLSPARKEQKENRIIHFWPAEPCSSCHRLTIVAVLDRSLQQCFQPYCPLHGYANPYSTEPTARELANERFSIERFVLWMHGEQGSVLLTSSIEPEQVAGHQLSTNPYTFEPLAWHCRYESPTGERWDVQVILDVNENQFRLFRDAVLVTKRREEVL
jgi:hypothetical protein